jgi:hypothetical protein
MAFAKLSMAFGPGASQELNAARVVEKTVRAPSHYSFCRVHQTLKTTPAIAAGIASHIWSVHDIITLTRTLEDAA